MGEGEFILPQQTNDGLDTSAIAQTAIAALATSFGGATVVAGLGYWIDPETKQAHNEPVWTIRAAYERTEANHQRFEQIAREAAAEASQISLYLRYADGEVKIANILERQQAAQAA